MDHQNFRLAISTAVGVAVMVAAPHPAVRAAEPTPRSVYIAAVDAKGGFVRDLQASEIVVKENRQAREVTGLVAATEPLHVAVLVDDGGEGLLQAPVARLLSGIVSRGQVAISLLNPQPTPLNDYTSDVPTLKASLDRIVQRGRINADRTQVPDGIAAAARDQLKRKLSRPVIIALTTTGEEVEPTIAKAIMEELRDSGASLHVAHVGGIAMGRVLLDGPVNSGGSSAVANSISAFADAMNGVVARLSNQFLLTYVLPDGVKPNEVVEITTNRPGVTILAPTRMPR